MYFFLSVSSLYISSISTYFLFGSFLLKSNLSDNTVNATLQTLLSSVRRAICVGPTTTRFIDTFNPLKAGGVTNPYLLILSATSLNLQMLNKNIIYNRLVSKDNR